ncbi:DUF3564 family protein [Paraburkholderia hospita]|uniref:DUF3564 family protein n=1 Tax=Paraburkholderia hospita TaxID=169430 RepID=UPI0008A77F25|nr:DUF3564 family protein [Paraburkholderia hospita]SEI26216.1 Protein of unknown function [Paraburkholderia hospita]
MNVDHHLAQELAHIRVMIAQLELLVREDDIRWTNQVNSPDYWRARINAILATDPPALEPLCALEGLDLRSGTEGPFEGEVGRAQWCRDDGLAPAPGHWHVQCVDQEVTRPEHNALAADGSESCSRRR